MMGASMKDWDKETDGEDNIGQDGKIKQESRSDSDWWIWKHVYFGQIGILFIQSDLFCKSKDLLKVEKKHPVFTNRCLTVLKSSGVSSLIMPNYL